ncbi:MAG: glucose-1-phosphate thymidylyltransferase [Chloroherpetonaceae bacterium]|nr:glucose-1-phosphate thymidylyltransferase [Chloroherpetonaceae bacterium]
MKALITSGGRGTRLRPITHTQNKHLIPIANKPMLHYAIDSMVEAGVKEIGIVTNAENKAVEVAIGTGKQWGVKITYIPQEAPLGLAHVVKISEDFIKGDPFIFYLGDNMLVGGVKRFIEEFKEKKSNCHLTLSKVKDPERFGVPELKNGRIVSIEEKPKKPKSDYAVAGIYLYDSSIFDAVKAIKPSERGELEISDAHQYLLSKKKIVTYSEITGWWKDTGKPYDLLEANRLVLENHTAVCEGKVDEETQISGKVSIGKGSVVKNSVLRGPIIIGENCHIQDSYIGPFTSIFDKCIVKKSEVEFSIILKDCRIEDVGIRIEESLLGNDVEIVSARKKPRTNRFMLGDQSRVEVV